MLVFTGNLLYLFNCKMRPPLPFNIGGKAPHLGFEYMWKGGEGQEGRAGMLALTQGQSWSHS